MYSRVPKKHHTQDRAIEEQIFHLLAETQEDIRYWVHDLRCVVCGVGGRVCMCFKIVWKSFVVR